MHVGPQGVCPEKSWLSDKLSCWLLVYCMCPPTFLTARGWFYTSFLSSHRPYLLQSLTCWCCSWRLRSQRTWEKMRGWSRACALCSSASASVTTTTHWRTTQGKCQRLTTLEWTYNRVFIHHCVCVCVKGTGWIRTLTHVRAVFFFFSKTLCFLQGEAKAADWEAHWKRELCRETVLHQQTWAVLPGSPEATACLSISRADVVRPRVHQIGQRPRGFVRDFCVLCDFH